MDDLISRQAAIDVAVNYHLAHDITHIPNTRWNDGFKTGWNLRENDIIHGLEELPAAQPEQRWIPCNERYPEQDKRVIVTCGSYDFYVWDCMPNRGDDYFWEDEQGLYHNKYEAIAWFSLPEPYKEREAERMVGID